MISILEKLNTNINYIDFPKDEYINIQKRFNSNKSVFTVRVSNEYNNYKINQVLDTPFGFKVIVVNIIILKDIKKYDFYSKLSNEQINLLNTYKRFNIIELRKMN